ncbi:beta-galactosidase [Porphyromonadaceae bacterium NLAE-zl-C104]|uniref:glycoside hydrolase family 2 protein n=1 Tax=Proteiniphilum saccharofermentans TaxID=1642647 RepID=UPI0008EA2D75|nr:glycoside hydrolase family 2 TIM barrel-domain containing protein [Proteiniphilum saccharofermentans]SFS96605.1 beta-galactosidase [Porphyromonadaceae bacterium NLAE-zl-C104]
MIFRRFLISLFIIVSINQMVNSMSLDGKWLFSVDPYNLGLREQWYLPEHEIAGWDDIDVPGNWNCRIPYSDYTGAAWYRKTFVPRIEKNNRLFLCFESVYFDAEVWLNGEKLGSHNFGFTGFRFDITDKIVHDTENTVVVRVDNSYKVGASWNWGGIRRSVTVKNLPEKRIDQIFITSDPDINNNSALIYVDLRLSGRPSGELQINIYDPDSNVVITSSQMLKGDTDRVIIPLKLNNALLWDFENPHLYSAEAFFEKKMSYSIGTRFGIRKVEVEGYKLLINGKEVRLNGANWVPDDRFTGNILPEDVFKRDIDLMKECGVNLARLSHHALPKDVLDYIDEKGIFIFEEIPLWNKNKYVTANSDVPINWLTEVIEERYNHPSIIGWCVGNEIGRLSDNPDLENYLLRAFSHIKSIDTTRLAVYVTHTLLAQPWEPVMKSDMILYNRYGSHGEMVDKVNERYSGKPIFYAEYGRQVNSGDPNNSMVDYISMMDDMSGRDFLIGASVWTFNDYRTNYRDNSTDPMGNRPWGVVDVYRRKKRGFKDLQRVNSPFETFDLSVYQANESIELVVELMPRRPLSIPSYDIENHILNIAFINSDGKEIKSDKITLPVMKRGSEQQQFKLIHTSDPAIHSIRAELTSPLGYVIEERQYFLTIPQKPQIKYYDSSDKAIRIYYDRHPSSTEWYIEYSDAVNTHRSEKTINDHITIDELVYGQQYELTLVSVNNMGESRSDEKILIKTQAAELPPAIYHLRTRGNNIEVGYESANSDMCYEFLYSLSPNFKDPMHILTSVFGAVNLSMIEEGKPHYLKIRKRLRYGYESPWSMVYEVPGSSK